MDTEASLHTVISRCHRELERLFFFHQQALLVGELPQALEKLRVFTTLHNLHMRFEDEQLIPRLSELADPGGWPASLYQHEHRKIQELLARLDAGLSRLRSEAPSGTELHLRTIELLDYEKTFKGVCEHHQEREEKGMLPALDTQADTAWLRSVMDPFLAAWRSASPGQR